MVSTSVVKLMVIVKGSALFTVFRWFLKELSSNPAEDKTLLLCMILSLNLKLQPVRQDEIILLHTLVFDQHS